MYPRLLKTSTTYLVWKLTPQRLIGENTGSASRCSAFSRAAMRISGCGRERAALYLEAKHE